jgi:hypothetical protein
MWFARTECRFEILNVPGEWQKFCCVADALPYETLRLVADLVTSPPPPGPASVFYSQGAPPAGSRHDGDGSNAGGKKSVSLVIFESMPSSAARLSAAPTLGPASGRKTKWPVCGCSPHSCRPAQPPIVPGRHWIWQPLPSGFWGGLLCLSFYLYFTPHWALSEGSGWRTDCLLGRLPPHCACRRPPF